MDGRLRQSEMSCCSSIRRQAADVEIRPTG
jgi:hypothetical protein